MKRSEMIEIMRKAYEFYEGDKYGNITYIGRFKHVLDTIEKAGMLPPNDFYTNSDDEYLKEHFNKWESEND
jgi:hypothetical protein